MSNPSGPACGHGVYGRSVPCESTNGPCLYCTTNVTFHDLQDMLVGRILTVLDAVVTNEVQNKAVKDIAKMQIYDVVDSNRESILGILANRLHPHTFEAESSPSTS